jgi:O-antigen ligase
LLLCFLLLVLMSPVATFAGFVFRVLFVLAPLTFLWVFYGAARGGPKTMVALFLLVLLITDLSVRQRTLSDTSVDPQNMLKMAIWGSGLLVALLNWRHLRAGLREPAVVMMVLMTLWFVATSIYSPIRLYSFGSAVAFLSVVLFAVVVRRVVPESLLLRSSIILLTIMLLVGLALYVVAPDRAMAEMEGGSIRRLAAPFGTPNSLGRVSAIVIVLAMLAVMSGVLRWRSPEVLVAVAAGLACLYLSQSRTAMAALGLGLLILHLAGRPRQLLLAGVLAGFVALLIAILGVDIADVLRLFSRTGHVSEVTTLTGRTDIWSFAWSQIVKEPVFGYGHASSKHLFPLLFHQYWGWTTTHAHNMWLQIWFTTGLVGVVLLAGVFIAQSRYWLQTRDPGSLALLVFVFVIGLAEAAHIAGAPTVLTAMWALWVTAPRAPQNTVAQPARAGIGQARRPAHGLRA